jgi:transcriptional regulator with XRE-family HTH domain
MYDLASILQAFGTKIRARRKAKKLSQMSLAKAAGLHRTYIADVERGARNASMGSIARIAGALEVSISELCRGIERMPAQPVKLPPDKPAVLCPPERLVPQ